MKSFRNLPQRMPRDDREWAMFLTALAEIDVRNDETEFASGLKVDESGNAILGDDARFDTRISTNLKTIVSRLGDAGRAVSQSLLPPVNRASRSSVQTSSVLTAVDTGAAVTINIAAHTLAIDTGDVSYSAGSIAGLNYATTYFLYASDAELDGGPVTYLATIDQAVVVSDPDFYYVGAILTPGAVISGTITGATNANPVVITAVNTFSAGQQVDITDVGGMIELNGNRYTVANPTGTTFELSGVDGTAFGVYTTGGTATLFVAPTGGGGGGGWEFNLP